METGIYSSLLKDYVEETENKYPLFKNSRTETGTTPSRVKHSVRETGLSTSNHNCTKTSFEEIHDSLNEAKHFPNRSQTSLEDDDTEHVIYKLVGHKNTSKEMS